jgi:hypothetical protein
MAERSWTGSAADLLRAGIGRSSSGTPPGPYQVAHNPRALAGRLRRPQTFLRAMGIEITFIREGQGFQTWDGKKWNMASDWITSDDSVIAPMVKEAAAKYAVEKKITAG